MNPITLIPVSIEDIRPLIHSAYEGDEDLISKYQAGNWNFEECVNFNFDELLSCLNNLDFKGEMKGWRISAQVDGSPADIGYCVTVHNVEKPHWLFSFGINIKHRNSVFLLGWLQEVERLLGVPYYAALWKKNQRAISFFEKNDFTIKSNNEDTFKYLFKRYDLIPDKLKEAWQLV